MLRSYMTDLRSHISRIRSYPPVNPIPGVRSRSHLVITDGCQVAMAPGRLIIAGVENSLTVRMDKHRSTKPHKLPLPNSMAQITGSVSSSRSPSGMHHRPRLPRFDPDSPGQIHVTNPEFVVLVPQNLVRLIERLVPKGRIYRQCLLSHCDQVFPLATQMCVAFICRSAATVPTGLVRANIFQCRSYQRSRGGGLANHTSTSIPRFATCRSTAQFRHTSPAFQCEFPIRLQDSRRRPVAVRFFGVEPGLRCNS